MALNRATHHRHQIARLPNRQSINSLETEINVNNVHYQEFKAGNLIINNCNIDRDIDNTTYLQIILVTIHNNTNSVGTCALLDTGSDATLILEEIAHKLKLKVKCVTYLFQMLCQWKINYHQN